MLSFILSLSLTPSLTQSVRIPVRGQSARVPVAIKQDGESLELCELLPGKTYEVRLVAEPAGAPPALLQAGKDQPAEVLRITTDNDCLPLVVRTDRPFSGYLSAYCADCEPTLVEKMMGITTQINSNATFLIEDVFIGGGCFDIAGVSSRGSSIQLGTFNNGGTSIDIETGVILSTGNVNSAVGPNALSSTSGNGGPGGDADLAQLTNGSINDVVALEFDFTPTIDQISFEYVFASEEYCEFVNSTFNDVFGFFISGPGINGPFTNNAANIALIPGTANYVSINNVNGASNNNFYRNNLNPGQHACNNEPPVAYSQIEYDGFTTVLTAVANVIPCQTYHIKLVLADVGDGAYDSAVFLKANSFNPGNYATGDATISGIGPTDDTAYEGCGDASITFARTSNDLSEDYIVSYFISPASTATMGVDYSMLPNPIVIPAGQASVTINLGVVADNIPEGVESIILELEEPCSCTNGTIEIYIEDSPPLQLDTPPVYACEGQSATIAPDIIGGTPGYTYNWGNGSTDPSITITPPLGVSYYPVAVTDECGQTANTTIEVIADAPSATLSGDGTICQGNFQTFLEVAFTGLGPWTITYEVDGFVETVSGITFSPLNLPVSLPGTYQLLSVSSNGCEGDVSGTGFIDVEEILLDPQILDVSCHGENDGSIQLNISGGNGPYGIEWGSGLPSNTATVDGLSPGYYLVTVTDANGCQGTEGIALSEPPALTLDLLSVQYVNCENPGGGIEVSVNGGTGLYDYQWSDGSTGAALTNAPPGDYTLIVTDGVGCTTELSATIEDDTAAPTALIEPPGLLTCAQTSLTLDAQASSTGTDFSYQWSTTDGNIIGGGNQLAPQVDAPGTYTLVVVNNANACTDTSEISVLQDIAAPVAEAGPAGTLTCAVSSLQLSADSSSTGAHFIYEWTSGGGNITEGANTLQPTVDAAGVYQLLVTDTLNGCTSIDQVEIIQDATPPALTIHTPDQLTCTQTTVIIDAGGSATGAGFQYTWTTTDGNLTGLTDSLVTTADTPGSYTLSILNTANGCTSSETITIEEDVNDPVAEAGPTAELDCEASSATLDGAGSSTGNDFAYQWSTTTGNIQGGADGLSPSVTQPAWYYLTVTNTGNGCTSVDSVQITENSNAPTALASLNGILNCEVTSLTINALGSSSGSDFDISWSSPQGYAFDDSNPLQVVVDQPGAYIMTITDLTNSCVSTATVQVQQDITAPIAEAGAPFELNCNQPEAPLDGSASSQGDPFSYTWSTPDGHLSGDSTSLDPLATTGGTYYLAVRNNTNGCTTLDSVVIAEDKAPPVADAGNDGVLDCDHPSFTIQAGGSSAGPGITYQWTADNGLDLGAGLTPTVTQAGTYELLVTNSDNGCSSVDVVAVTANFAIPLADPGAAATLTCAAPQVSLDGSASSQGPDFSYSWTSPEGNILSGGDGLFPLIDQAGIYQLVVTNLISACADTATVAISEDFAAPTAEAGPAFVLDCFQPENSLDGSASSQGPGFSYLWSTADGQLSGDPATLHPIATAAGLYVIEVVNTQNGCISMDSVMIEEDKTLPSADAGPDGLINCAQPIFSLQGQNSSTGAEFSYQWNADNGAGLPPATSPTVDQAGLYELVVTNTQNGCVSRDTAAVAANFETPVAQIALPGVLNCYQPQLSLDAGASSQDGPLAYQWSTTNGQFVSGADGLAPVIDQAGTYQLIITHTESLCADTALTVVTDHFEAPAADAGPAQEITCFQPVVTLGGFSASGPGITYQWSTTGGEFNNNDTQPDPGVSTGGTYVLTVTDTENGCQSVDSVIIAEDTVLPAALAGPDQILNCSQPTITLTTQGSSTGTGFHYQWTTLGNASPPAGADPEVALPDTYILVVSNLDNGCASADTVTISANFATPIADAGAPATLNCNQPLLTLDGTGSSQGSGLTFSWTTGDGNILQHEDGPNPLIDAAGSYQLIVTDPSSFCSDTATVLINENFVVPAAVIDPPAILTCDEPEVSLDGSASSQSPTIVYEWITNNGVISGQAGLAATTVTAAGAYTLQVTDTENGCQSTATVIVDSDQVLPAADAGAPVTLNCNFPTLSLNGSASESGPAIAYTWTTDDGLLLSGGNTPTPAVGGAGQYQLRVTNTETGCFNLASVAVAIDTVAPAAAAGPALTLSCADPALPLDGSGSSAGPGFSYAWTGPGLQGGINSLSPTVNQAGAYVLTVTNNQNGCLASDQVNVTVDTLAPIVSTAVPGILTCAVTSIELEADATGNAPLSYQWSTGNGLIATGAATLTPTVTGAGAYQLLVTNTGNGCTTLRTIAVSIDTIAPLAEAGVADQIDCDHPTVTLDGNLSDGGNHLYQWTTDDGSILSGATTLAPVVDDPGTYQLLVTNQSNGCQSTDFVTVSIDEAVPSVAILPPQALTCARLSVTLISDAPAGFDYQWFDQAGTPLGLDNPTTIEVHTPGPYQLVVTDPTNGCSNSETVMVEQDITPPLAEAGNDGELNCQVTTLELDGNSSSQGPQITYSWSTNDGFIISGANTSRPVINREGMYLLTVTNQENGCTATDQVEVVEIVPRSADISVRDPLCFGDQGALTISNVQGGYGPYLYSINGGETFSTQTTFFDLAPGLFDIVIQDANGCEIAEEAVVPVPLEMNLFLETQAVITIGETYQLSAQVNLREEEIASVTWSPARNLSCTDCLQPLASPLETTVYEITVENQNGCTISADIMLIVQQAPIYIPSAFSPYNNDGTNDRLVIYAKEGTVRQVNALQIFNRWGESVYEVYDFQPNDPQYGWNGTHRGLRLNPGVFVYWTEVELIDGTLVLIKGDVTLMN